MRLVYLRYKAYRFALWMAGLKKSAVRVSTYWNIYIALFIYASLLYFFYGEVRLILVMFAAFFMLLIFTVYQDYKSGRHVHWMREHYRQLGAEQKEGR